MNKRSLTLNLEYAGDFAAYWIYYGMVGSFCSAYLLDLNYTNSEIGLIMALASVVSVFLQPALADLSDRSKKLDQIGVASLGTIVMLVLNVGLLIIRRKTAALWVIYILALAWELALQPVLNSFSRKLSESGHKINFGICRSGGSLGYSVLMVVMGSLTDRFGTGIIPGSGMVALAVLLGLLILTKKTLERTKAERGMMVDHEVQPEIIEEEAEEINLISFVKRNKLFIALNLFILILYFQNAILNNFMFQVVDGVGGDAEDLGRVLGVMAFLEIPALFFFDKLNKRFSCTTLLKVASVCFVIKLVLLYLANSVTMIYVGHIFHLTSFPLFLPAIVQFVNEIMAKGEAVKGQAMYTTAITISSVFASILGGIILDMSGPKLMLLVSAVLTAIGALGVLMLVDKVPKHSRTLEK